MREDRAHLLRRIDSLDRAKAKRPQACRIINDEEGRQLSPLAPCAKGDLATDPGRIAHGERKWKAHLTVISASRRSSWSRPSARRAPRSFIIRVVTASRSASLILPALRLSTSLRIETPPLTGRGRETWPIARPASACRNSGGIRSVEIQPTSPPRSALGEAE